MNTFSLVKDFFSELFTINGLIALGAFSVGLIVCFILIPVIIKLSNRYNLVDIPNERKVHKVPISRLGGLGIMLGVLFSVPLWFIKGNSEILIFLLAGMAILILVGVIDDIRELPPKIKFIGQAIAALLIAYAGLLIDNLFGIFGINHIPIPVQYFLTVFIVAGIINAFNLIDGIDGLAGGLALIDMISFFAFFMISREPGMAVIVASVSGALLAFLYYNYHPAKIFMGDTGAMNLGLLLSAVGIMALVISRNANPYFNYSEAAIIVFSIFILPVYDTLRVFTGRVLNKKSPFHPDKTHIHHLLMKTGFNHPKSAKILYAANIALILTGFYMRTYKLALMAPLLFLEAILFSEFLTLYKLIIASFRGKKLKSKVMKMQGDNRLLIDNLEEKNGAK